MLSTCLSLSLYFNTLFFMVFIKNMRTNEKEVRYIFNNQGNNSLVYDNFIITYCRPNKDGSINYKCRHHKLIGDINVPCQLCTNNF